MKKALTRLWQWCYHPSIRHDPTARGKAILYRYPSPGNIIPDVVAEDYKRPFQTSQYNVRHNYGLTHPQKEQRLCATVALSHDWNLTDKLVVLGFLKANDVNNQEAIEAAKKAFQKYYNVPATSNVLRNDSDIPMPNPKDREAVRQAIISNIAIKSLDYELNKLEMDDAVKTDPNLFTVESLDFYSDPHFQQQRLRNQYILQKIANARADADGGMDVRKGEAKFWKAIDDSNDLQNIQKVQGKIGDENPLAFELRNGKVIMEFDKDGNVIDLHRKD